MEHPGVTLRKILIKREIRQEALASKVRIPYCNLRNILYGKQRFHAHLCDELEKIGIKTRKEWIDLCRKYELSLVNERWDKYEAGRLKTGHRDAIVYSAYPPV